MGLSDGISKARELLLPWAAMIGAALAWTLSDQVGSDLLQAHCGAAHPLVELLIGIGGVAVAVTGILLSIGVARGRGPAGGARRFIAAVGIGMSALFCIAIFLQTTASLIIPRCYG